MEDLKLRHLEDVSTLALDKEKCIGCSLCTEVCPQAVFEMKDKKSARELAEQPILSRCG